MHIRVTHDRRRLHFDGRKVTNWNLKQQKENKKRFHVCTLYTLYIFMDFNNHKNALDNRFGWYAKPVEVKHFITKIVSFLNGTLFCMRMHRSIILPVCHNNIFSSLCVVFDSLGTDNVKFTCAFLAAALLCVGIVD